MPSAMDAHACLFGRRVWFQVGLGLILGTLGAGCTTLQNWAWPGATEPFIGGKALDRAKGPVGLGMPPAGVSDETTVASTASPDPAPAATSGSVRTTVAGQRRSTTYSRTLKQPEPESESESEPDAVAVSLLPPAPSRGDASTAPRTGTARRSTWRSLSQPPAEEPGAVARVSGAATEEPAAPRTPRQEDPIRQVERLVAAARLRLDALTSYRVEVTGQERVRDRLQPPQEMVLSIRRNPKAVRIEWPAGPNKGREVIYAADANGGLMHVKAGLLLNKISMPVDSPMALANSRHPITEAGVETVVASLESALEQQAAGDPKLGRLSYGGLETPEGLPEPAHQVRRVTPEGETWVVYLDRRTKLPIFVQATDAHGQLLEKYVFRNLVANPSDLANADAFDPNARWGSGSGFLQRLAGGAAPAANTTTQ